MRFHITVGWITYTSCSQPFFSDIRPQLYLMSTKPLQRHHLLYCKCVHFKSIKWILFKLTTITLLFNYYYIFLQVNIVCTFSSLLHINCYLLLLTMLSGCAVNYFKLTIPTVYKLLLE